MQLMEAEKSFEFDLWHLIFVKLVEIDVNASRIAIENANEDAMLEDEESERNFINHHPQAAILDLCMNNLFEYINSKSIEQRDKLFEQFLQVFGTVILMSHNPHHIHFVMFYFTSLDVSPYIFF